MLIRFPFCGEFFQVIFKTINSPKYPRKQANAGAKDKETHVSKRYAIWGIDVEWLSLRILRAACGWITD